MRDKFEFDLPLGITTYSPTDWQVERLGKVFGLGSHYQINVGRPAQGAVSFQVSVFRAANPATELFVPDHLFIRHEPLVGLYGDTLRINSRFSLHISASGRQAHQVWFVLIDEKGEG